MNRDNLKKISKVLIILGVSIVAFISVLRSYAHGSWLTPVDQGTWMPIQTTIAYDAYFDRWGAKWVQVHQHFYWDSTNLANFKNKNADFQWELNRLGYEYWDYCSNTYTAYWTDLPDSTDFWAEEIDPTSNAFYPCGAPQSGDEEFEVKSRDPGALNSYQSYSVYVELVRDPPDQGQSLPYQTEAEWCSKAGPFCNYGQGFGWGRLTTGTFSNP